MGTSSATAPLTVDSDDAVCRAFQRALTGRERPDVEEFLAGIAEPRKSAMRKRLQECLHPSPRDSAHSADAVAWSQGDAPVATGYVAADTVQWFGRYRVEKPLGSGSFGQVLLAVDEELGRKVAIKTPRPRDGCRAHEIDKFLSEARVLAKLDHPAIVPVYDVGVTEDGRCYVVSKYVDGCDLAARIRQAPVTHLQAAAWVATMAEALHHAHEAQLVHRDVKPGNILLDHNERAFLADFGLALRAEDLGRGSPFAGTVKYMSPEQARGEGHLVDGRSDIFSLGVVLYVLLTGRRPFQGAERNAVLEAIKTHDPAAPRQVNRAIPKELDRICMQALAKRASDRFGTAADMAQDLRHFLEYADDTGAVTLDAALTDGESRASMDPIVPRGLRSFDAEDAEFFLKLLPGPYDRHGLPRSVRFWKTRIENTTAAEPFRVGLLYGPSGCGKSSLIKAGILPLTHRKVAAVFIEATPEGTETALLKAIAARCRDSGDADNLADTLTTIRRGSCLPEAHKLLIVIDQFEQWLHAHRGETETALCQALRQCDGQRLQCLLLVRDDFWMSATRFMHELEIRIVEGDNATAVDLFDPRHARKVLTAFGRAYQCLPPTAEAMTDEQNRFLDQAVEMVAQDGKVVPVQLVLFAEMVKHRPWTPATLRQFGGMQGVGAAFLDDAFSAPTAPPEHRGQERAARAVLDSLLPEHGTDIKGHMRSEGELREASGCPRPAEFDALLRTLDTELRLLTPVETAAEHAADAPAPTGERYYQLTHDYLVPALREWLTQKQRETFRGRTELRLAERAQFWTARPESKQLPSFGEWLTASLWTRRKQWTDPQRKMMRVARRYHLLRAGIVTLVLLFISAAAWQGFEQLLVANLVARLLEADTADVPTIVAELAPQRWRVRERLIAETASEDPRRSLHAALALLPDDASLAEFLLERLLNAKPVAVRVIRDALEAHVGNVGPRCWEILQDSHQAASRRFRAACVLAALAADDARWKDCGASVAAWLATENPTVVKEWGDMLQPVRRTLQVPLQTLFTTGQSGEQFASAIVLAEYLHDDVPQLVALTRVSNATQRHVLADKLRDHLAEAVPLLTQDLARPNPAGAKAEACAALVREKGRVATMLMLQGRPDPVWPLLSQIDDPQLRTCLIHYMAPAGVDPGLFVARLQSAKAPPLRISLAQCLGEYHQSPLLTGGQRQTLVPWLLERYENDPDSGFHSTCEWLLRRLGEAPKLRAVHSRLTGSGPRRGRNWLVNGQGQTLFVVRPPTEFMMGSPDDEEGRTLTEKLVRYQFPYAFSITVKEVTLREFRRFWPDFAPAVTDAAVDDAVQGVDFLAAMAYCDWLSGNEQIPREQRCFVHDADGVLYPVEHCTTRTGYRLPTGAEWEYACRAMTTTRRYDGYGEDFVGHYAWYAGNSDQRVHPPGLLKPNDFGLFDTFGNVEEWCLDPVPSIMWEPKPGERGPAKGDFLMRDTRGYRYSVPAVHFRAAAHTGSHVRSDTPGYGFRVARTLSVE